MQRRGLFFAAAAGAIAVALLGMWRAADAGRSAGPRRADDVQASRPELTQDVAPAPIATAEAFEAPRERSEVGALDSLELRVLSAVGLPLERVEIRDADGNWRPHRCVAGVVQAHGALPLEVRAPGHVERIARSTREPVALEADALFTLEDQGRVLRRDAPPCLKGDATPRVGPDELTALVCAGVLDDGRYALAVSSDRLTARGANELELELPTEVGVSVLCKLRHAPYLRAHGKLNDIRDAQRAPLHVIVRSVPAQESPRVIFRLRSFGRRIGSWLAEENSQKIVGEIAIHVGQLNSVLPLDGGKADIPDLRLNANFEYFAHDEASGAWAKGQFQHKGQALEIELAGGARLRGRLVCADGSPPPALADFTVRWSAPASTSRRMLELFGADGDFQEFLARPIAPDGRFEIACVDSFHVASDTHAQLHVGIAAENFTQIYWSGDVERAPVYDLGTLELRITKPWIEVASGHGVRSREYFNPQLACDGKTWFLARIRLNPNGGLTAYAPEPPHERIVCYDSLKSRELEAQVLPPAPAFAALLFRIQEGAHATVFMERDSGGHYACAPREPIDVDFAITPNDDPDLFWRLFLGWHGAYVWVGEIDATLAGEIVRRRFVAPRNAQLAFVPHRRLNAGVSDALAEPQFVLLDAPLVTATLR